MKKEFFLRNMDDLDLKGSEHRVLSHLIRRMNGQRICWPGQDSISKICRLHKRSVKRAIQGLEDHGVIQVTRGDGRGNNSTYTVMPFSAWKRVTLEAVKGDITTPKRETLGSVKGDKSTPQEPTGPEKEREEPKINNPARCFYREEDSDRTDPAKEEADTTSLAILEGSRNLAVPKISGAGNTRASNAGNTRRSRKRGKHHSDLKCDNCHDGHLVERNRLKDKLPFAACSNPYCSTFHPLCADLESVYRVMHPLRAEYYSGPVFRQICDSAKSAGNRASAQPAVSLEAQDALDEQRALQQAQEEAT